MNHQVNHSASGVRGGKPARSTLAAALALAFGAMSPTGADAHALQSLAADAHSPGPCTIAAAQRRDPSGIDVTQPLAMQGQSIAVTSCADSGTGSLRAAVSSAVSGDTIDASGLACGAITLSTAITIGADDLAIVGAGPRSLTISNGAKYGRVFTHVGSGTLELRGVTISSGVVSPTSSEADTRGGCVFSNGNVALGNLFDPADAAQGVIVQDCTAIATQADSTARGGGVFAMRGLSLASSIISGGRAVAQDAATHSNGGGAAVNAGSFTMKYSELRDNAASGPLGFSGGVDAAFVDSVYLSHSTIAGNDASVRAGGAYLGTDSGNAVSIDNTTISANSSDGEGGLVVNVMSGPTPGSIRIASSTFSANSSTGITGGAFFSGPIEIDGSIFAGNAGTDIKLTMPATGADNLVGTYSGALLPQDGLIVTSNPGLAPLAGNGGLTRTHALLDGSPAIDAGNDAFNSSTDQRGLARSLGNAPDIGAYERDPDLIFSNGLE